jgi:hypothetical protein
MYDQDSVSAMDRIADKKPARLLRASLQTKEKKAKINVLINLGFEPRTFSVLTKCDNHYTNRPCECCGVTVAHLNHHTIAQTVMKKCQKLANQ